MQAMVFLSGAPDIESVDSHTAEQFMALLRRPLKINLSSRSRLTESGLLSPYQTASLLDYISSNGDVLSVAELAAVDGFGYEYAAALEYFSSRQFLGTATVHRQFRDTSFRFQKKGK